MIFHGMSCIVELRTWQGIGKYHVNKVTMPLAAYTESIQQKSGL
jgi:hypothetical protein